MLRRRFQERVALLRYLQEEIRGYTRTSAERNGITQQLTSGCGHTFAAFFGFNCEKTPLRCIVSQHFFVALHAQSYFYWRKPHLIN